VPIPLTKNSSTGWNDDQWSDLKMTINSQKEKKTCELNIPKIKLKKIGKLSKEIMQKPQSNTLTHELDEDTQLIHFLDALRCLYKKEPLESPREQYFSILNVALKYDIPRTIKQCLRLLGEEKMNYNDALNLLKYTEQFEKYDNINQDLLKNAESEILKHFQSTRDIFVANDEMKRKMEEFKKLPLGAILAIIRSDDFRVDSENSVFYAVMLWLLAQKFDRFKERKVMAKILPNIRFPQMRIHFLLDIVPVIRKYFHVPDNEKNTIRPPDNNEKKKDSKNEDDDIEKIIEDMYEFALEYKTGGKNRLEKKGLSGNQRIQLTPRSNFKDANTVVLKNLFQGVSNWDPTSRYFSNVTVSNGYEFYFFLQKKSIDNSAQSLDHGDNDNSTVGVFLRCTSKFMPERHYLPIRYLVQVTQKGGGVTQDRRFQSIVLFENSAKAMGGKLTVDDDNWSNIIDGTSSIVVNDTISVTVTVEFLDDAKQMSIEQ
jgi:hypothetical protein